MSRDGAAFLSRIPERAAAPDRAALRRPILVGAALSALWLLLLTIYAIGWFSHVGDEEGARRAPVALEAALFFFAAILPPALIGCAALLARRAEQARAETARLSAAIDALRLALPRAPTGQAKAAAAQDMAEAARAGVSSQMAELSGAVAAIARRMEEMRETAPAPEPAAKPRKSGRRTAPVKARPKDQPGLPLLTEAQEAAEEAAAEGIAWTDVARALDFPRDESDRDGFEVLRGVLRDRGFAELLQAAEDALTMLAEDGLFMEDLPVTHGTVADWRRYADGERGPAAAGVAGVADADALAKVRDRVAGDAVFRDTALHFIRRYDALIARVFRELGDDPTALELADTRTGRAFMVIARVLGAFD